MDYNAKVTPEEAQKLQIAGRYSELLRDALGEQAKARGDARRSDELRWTLFVAKACRFIGRTTEGLAHANHAVELARDGEPQLRAQAHYVQAMMLRCARRF